LAFSLVGCRRLGYRMLVIFSHRTDTPALMHGEEVRFLFLLILSALAVCYGVPDCKWCLLRRYCLYIDIS
jgi:hypothetical protein